MNRNTILSFSYQIKWYTLFLFRSFELSGKYKPHQDLMSKLILSEPRIVNIIVTKLIRKRRCIILNFLPFLSFFFQNNVVDGNFQDAYVTSLPNIQITPYLILCIHQKVAQTAVYLQCWLRLLCRVTKRGSSLKLFKLSSIVLYLCLIVTP